MDVGIDPDPAMRLTALVSFVIAAFCLWRLVRRMADAVTAVAALVAFLFSPFAIVVGLGWARYADVVRTADGARPWLCATALADFLFGAPLDRLDPTAWSAIAVALGLVVGPALLVILWSAKDAGFVHGAQGRFWLSFIGAPLLAVVVFFNVYRIHDYYSAAI